MRFHAVLVNPLPTGNTRLDRRLRSFNAHSPGEHRRRPLHFRDANLGTIQRHWRHSSLRRQLPGPAQPHRRSDAPLPLLTSASTSPNAPPCPLNTPSTPSLTAPMATPTSSPSMRGSSTPTSWRGAKSSTPPASPGATSASTSLSIPAHRDVLRSPSKPGRLMTGQMQMHTKFDLPPAPAAVTDRLPPRRRLRVTGTHFTSEHYQQDRRAQPPRQAKPARPTRRRRQKENRRPKRFAQYGAAQNGAPQPGTAAKPAPPQTNSQPGAARQPVPPPASSAADIAAEHARTSPSARQAHHPHSQLPRSRRRHRPPGRLHPPGPDLDFQRHRPPRRPRLPGW